VRKSIVDFIMERGAWIADTIERRLWPQGQFDFLEEEEQQ
jgi:hypothetical protein